MSIELSRAYLEEIRFCYRNSTKKQKGLILNEFCLNCGYDRKYAIKTLNRRIEPRTRRLDPNLTYNFSDLNMNS